MVRSALVAVLAMVLVACGSTVANDPTPTPARPPASQAPSPDDDPTPSPSVAPQPSAAEDPAVHPAEGLAIVRFPNSDDPTSQIFVFDANGDLTQVTGSGAMPGARGPAWSPDGEWIAFDAAKTGAPVIPPVGIVRADGRDEQVIGNGQNPRWSPDGRKMLFQEVVAVERPLLMYLADLETGEVTELGIGFDPRWLADGQHIAFDAIGTNADGSVKQTLSVMSLSDGSVVEIATDTHGVWSPDGSSVLLIDDEGIAIADADGSNPQPLAGGFSPAWSPDASRIVLAYDHNAEAIPVLAMVDREGRELWSGAIGESVAWSADGTKLAVGISYPEPMVQVLDAATGALLFETVGSDPAWRP